MFYYSSQSKEQHEEEASRV